MASKKLKLNLDVLTVDLLSIHSPILKTSRGVKAPMMVVKKSTKIIDCSWEET